MKKIIHIILILAIIISCLLSSVVISIDRHETSSGTTYGEIQSDTYNESNNLTLFRYPTGLDHVTELVQYPASGDKWDKINDTGTGDDDTTYVYTDAGGWQSAEWELSVPVQNNITINSVTIKAKCKINNILNVGSKLICFFEYLGDSYSQYVNHTSYQYLNWTITQDDEGNPLEGSDFVDNIGTFTYSASASYHIRITQLYYVIDYIPGFNVTRTVGVSSESNTFSFTPSINYTGNVILKVPVSSDAQGIINVTNNTGGGLATEVNGTDELVNDTFWYDSANDFLYIRTINITTSSSVNWTVLATYGMTFSLTLPTYLEVGDYFIATGLIKNATGVPVDGVLAKTRVLYSNGTDALETPPEWNCTNGNYYCVFSTSSLIPGVYSISIEFTDAGITYKEGGTLYLSFETPTGVYSNAVVFFSFYNTNIGLGLIPETFKVYVNYARNYINKHYGYTGEIINITIKDYYNFTMYSENYTIVQTYTGLNFGLTFHEYDFTNVNNEYFYASFLKENATRWYERVVSSSGGQKSFMLPSGNYSVRVYNADNSTYLSWNETINRSKAYLIGTDGVTLIIQGQSVIIGKFLEFSEDWDYFFMPDVESICRNIPYVWSSYQRRGTIAGFRLVCPYQAMTVTTKNETADNNFISYPLIPTNGTTRNGTIRIINDRIYLAGSSISWVNISYDGDYVNTSYIPSFVDPFGADVTINASADLTVTRETEFQQVKKFNWKVKEDTDSYEATVNFENALNASLRHVYCTIEFANDDMEEKEIEPDYPTVSVYDVTNGKYMTSGLNFQAEASGITFYIPAIAASETRSFTCFHETKTPAEISADAVERVDYYDLEELDGKNYYHCYAQWTNPKSTVFVGSLYIDFIFETDPYEIASKSFIVFDNENNRRLYDYEFGSDEDGLTITQDVIGSVAPNHARSFDVYFLFVSEDAEDNVFPSKSLLHKGIFPIPLTNLWVEVFHIFIILCSLGIGFPLADYFDKKTEKKKKNLYITVLACVFLLLFVIAYIQGV